MRMAKISERPNLPWRFTVVDVPAVNAFAVPGGVHLHHARHPAVPRQRGGAGRRARPRDRPRHGAPLRAAVHAQVGGQVGLVALGIFVPAARPFGELTGQALGVLFLKYGRDDELQADELGRAIRIHARVGSRRRCRRSSRRSAGSTKRRAIGAACRTGCPRIRIRCRASRRSSRRSRSSRPGARTSPPTATRCCSASTASSTATTRSRASCAATSSCTRCCVSASIFPTGGRWPTARSRWWPRRRAPTCSCCCSCVQKPQGANIQEIALNDMQNAGFRAVEGGRTTINGLEAFVGVYQGQIEGLGAVAMRAAHIAARQGRLPGRRARGAERVPAGGQRVPREHPIVPAAVGGRGGETSGRTAWICMSSARATRGSRSPSDRAARSSRRRWRS